MEAFMAAHFEGARRRAIHVAKRLFRAMSGGCCLGPLVLGFYPVHAQNGPHIEWEVYNRFPVYAGEGAAFFRTYAAQAEAALKVGQHVRGRRDRQHWAW